MPGQRRKPKRKSVPLQLLLPKKVAAACIARATAHLTQSLVLGSPSQAVGFPLDIRRGRKWTQPFTQSMTTTTTLSIKTNVAQVCSEQIIFAFAVRPCPRDETIILPALALGGELLYNKYIAMPCRQFFLLTYAEWDTPS
jgi:hypothetical protein